MHSDTKLRNEGMRAKQGYGKEKKKDGKRERWKEKESFFNLNNERRGRQMGGVIDLELARIKTE